MVIAHLRLCVDIHVNSFLFVVTVTMSPLFCIWFAFLIYVLSSLVLQLLNDVSEI